MEGQQEEVSYHLEQNLPSLVDMTARYRIKFSDR